MNEKILRLIIEGLEKQRDALLAACENEVVALANMAMLVDPEATEEAMTSVYAATAAALISAKMAQMVEMALAGFVGDECPPEIDPGEWAEFDVIDEARQWRAARAGGDPAEIGRAEVMLANAIVRMGE